MPHRKLNHHPVRNTLCLAAALLVCQTSQAAPAEDLLGKSAGYPVAPKFGQAFKEAYRVGSFSAMDSLSPHCTLVPSAQPQPLPKATRESALQYKFDGKSLTLDDYMQRQRATAIGEKLWQPLGADSHATWLTNAVDQTELAAGNFNATVHDYARLGLLLANDGQRDGKAIIAKDYLLRMTEASQQSPAWRPDTLQNKGSTYMGYGLQTWLLPGSHRRFVLLGIYGQAIMVDPELKPVVVHMAVARDASGDASGTHMGAERNALWRGIVTADGNW